MKLEDEAVPVAENLARTIRWEAPFSVSDNGFLSFQAGANSDLAKLILLDRDGKELQTFAKQADYRNPVLSHDGRRIATVIVDPATGKTDIWVLDVERGTSTRLTFDPADEMQPVWSPDDRYIYFTSRRQGKGDIFRKQSSGIGAEEVVLADPEWSMLNSLTADGKTGGAMTQNVAGKTEWDISLLNVDERKSTVLLQTPFSELTPMLSRDGKWLAYQASESGRNEVYVQRLDGEGGKWQISTDGGNRPRWSQGERELVFMSLDFKLMTVDVELGSNFKVSVPRLFMNPGIRQLLGYQYDISADGSRVLVNLSVDQAVVEPVTLVQNWTEGLGK